MSEMKRVEEIIVVEGRYDKNAVSQVVDGTIIETSGYGIFSQKEKVELIKRLAEKRGVIILTDSDGAGFLIRGHLKGMLCDVEVKHAYIPDKYGREKRKRAPSKEGKLGVEGMSPEIILAALERCGATFSHGGAVKRQAEITKADMFRAGLSGGADSAARRSAILKELALPERLTANGLLEVLNILMTKEEFLNRWGE